jgi:GAF domain-containing protein/HAMP domain-containing protein
MFLMSLFVITGLQTWLRDNTNQHIAFLLSIILTLIAFAVLWLFTHRVVARSLSKLLNVAERWRSGELTAQVELNTRDEFQQLGDTFNQLSYELNHSLKGLEKTVAERTLTLQRRARQLQAAADVGRVAVTIRDLDILLPEVTRLISIRFNVYHVGIFLIDENGEYALLKASTSNGGEQVLQEQYRLKVGTQGIVGLVASQGEPRISQDVGTDTIHYKNPYLPDTRSEIALPLSVAGSILGVLDVQSTRPAAFTEEDASILQIMADQVAIAIDNARLLTENSKALEVSRRAYGELSREVWSNYLKSRPDMGFVVSRDNLTARPSSRQKHSVMTMDRKSVDGDQVVGDTAEVPIKLRDHVIGVFHMQKAGTTKWTEEEIEFMQSISDQVSIALEAARLFDDTQRRAERERLAGEITSRMRASNDPQEILQIAIKELRSALQVSKAQVIIAGAPEGEYSQNQRKTGGSSGSLTSR